MRLKGTYYGNSTFPGKKSVHDFLSGICISESTQPTVTKQASQFQFPLLCRKGAELNITYNFPTPLQSERSYNFVDQRTSSSGGGNSPAAQLREYDPFLCRRHRQRRRHGEERDCTPRAELPGCRRATPAGLFSSRRTPTRAAGKLWRQFSSRSIPELPDCQRPDGFDGSQTAAEASAADRQLRWCRQFGISAPGVQSLSLPSLSSRFMDLRESRPKLRSTNSFQP